MWALFIGWGPNPNVLHTRADRTGINHHPSRASHMHPTGREHMTSSGTSPGGGGGGGGGRRRIEEEEEEEALTRRRRHTTFKSRRAVVM